MFCCTLIALILSQPALAYGAIKARFFGKGAASVEIDTARQWRNLILFGLLAIDAVIVIAGIHFLRVYGTSTLRAICGLAP
jgi:hypothetical protein